MSQYNIKMENKDTDYSSAAKIKKATASKVMILQTVFIHSICYIKNGKQYHWINTVAFKLFIRHHYC